MILAEAARDAPIAAPEWCEHDALLVARSVCPCPHYWGARVKLRLMDWGQEREDVEEHLRKICVALPEVHEGPAANGRSWLIRKNHFCQVFTIDEGDEQKGIIIFRSEPPELDALAHAGHPFFKPGWGARVMCMVIDDDLDWDEVAELIAESYCIQAPRKLALRVKGVFD